MQRGQLDGHGSLDRAGGDRAGSDCRLQPQQTHMRASRKLSRSALRSASALLPNPLMNKAGRSTSGLHTQLINGIIGAGSRQGEGEARSKNQRQHKVVTCQLVPMSSRDAAFHADQLSASRSRSGSAAHRTPLWQPMLMAVVSSAKLCRTTWRCQLNSTHYWIHSGYNGELAATMRQSSAADDNWNPTIGTTAWLTVAVLVTATQATPAHSVWLCLCNLPQARATSHCDSTNCNVFSKEVSSHNSFAQVYAGVQAQPQVLIRVCVDPESQQVTFTSEYISLGKQLPLATHVEFRLWSQRLQHTAQRLWL